MFGAHISSLLGELELARGRAAAAIELLVEARIGLEPFGDFGGWLYSTLSMLTQALAVAGRTAEARRAWADAQERRHPMMAFLLPEEMLAHVAVLAGEGALSSAIATVVRAASHARAAGYPAYEVICWQTAVRLGDVSGAARLDELREMVEGPRAVSAAQHAAALTDGDANALLMASEAWEELGDLLTAAEAAVQGHHRAVEQGDRSRARVSAARALRLIDETGGASTPTLLTLTRPLPLTSREREVVTLAARGMTNQQIADLLVVSVRTVEGHVYHASTKLHATRDRFGSVLAGA
jgi:DNA-binding NarL/FixJ family response regulator